MWGFGLGAAFVQIPSASLLLIQNGYNSISTVPLGLIMFLSSPCAVVIPRLITSSGEKAVFIAASGLGVFGSLLQMTAVLVATGTTELVLVLLGASINIYEYPDSLTVFIIGMSLVGLGWNLSFVGPSSEVSKIYHDAEKYKVLGFNDGVMLMTIGVFNLAGSSIYYAVGGWVAFNYVLMGTSVFSALLAGVCGVRARKKRTVGC